MHTAGYAVLGGLWTRAISQSWRALPTTRVLLSAVLFTTLYGLSDEWHQTYIPGRTPEMADILADIVGGMLGSLGFLWLKARKKVGWLGL
jgi:VanZ family protein